MAYKGSNLRSIEDSNSYFFRTGNHKVDADGAPNAYHPADAGKPCRGPGLGLDCPANAGYPSKNGWKSVLAADPSDPDTPFVQTNGPHAGFFVSQTALYDKGNAIRHDPARYVDARTVPYVVFPAEFSKLKGTGFLGDIGMAYNRKAGLHTFFIVADIGPNQPLGESSIGLLEAVGGEGVNPRTGSGVPNNDLVYLVFPGSRSSHRVDWPISAPELTRAGLSLVSQLGGLESVLTCF